MQTDQKTYCIACGHELIEDKCPNEKCYIHISHELIAKLEKQHQEKLAKQNEQKMKEGD